MRVKIRVEKNRLSYCEPINNKTVFELSIIENVQRHTLNPIEEGLAFRKYVSEFGWGGVSELAEKLWIKY